VTNSDDKVQKHIFILISYEIKKNKRGMLATNALTITNRQTLRYWATLLFFQIWLPVYWLLQKITTMNFNLHQHHHSFCITSTSPLPHFFYNYQHTKIEKVEHINHARRTGSTLRDESGRNRRDDCECKASKMFFGRR
jgi:hypothetical protein